MQHRKRGLKPRASGLLGAALLVIACGQRGAKPPPTDTVKDAAAAPVARPLDDAGLAALAAVTVADARVEVVRRAVDDFAAIVTAADGARALVTISRCATCAPIAVAAWERDRPSLTALYAPAAGDGLTLALRDPPPWSTIELVARRTVEGVAEVLAQRHWNDGAVQLAATCEQPGGDEAERACTAILAAATKAYLPVLAP